MLITFITYLLVGIILAVLTVRQDWPVAKREWKSDKIALVALVVMSTLGWPGIAMLIVADLTSRKQR